jgi:hypothetical protein
MYALSMTPSGLHRGKRPTTAEQARAEKDGQYPNLLSGHAPTFVQWRSQLARLVTSGRSSYNGTAQFLPSAVLVRRHAESIESATHDE